MTYAAVTDKALKEIRMHITSMANAELATLDNVSVEFNKIVQIPELREEIEVAAWGEFVDLRHRLAQRLCCAGTIEISVYYKNDAADSKTAATASVKIDKFPFGILRNDEYYKLTLYKYAFRYDHEHAHIQGLMHLLAERSEVQERWGKVMQQVIQFVRNAKSINEAVKLWPDLKAYLPRGIIVKLEEKAGRKQTANSAAKTLLEKMDIETLKHSAVISKMLQKG